MFATMIEETTTVLSKVDGVFRLSTPASATDNLPLGGASIRVVDACMTVSSVGDGWEAGADRFSVAITLSQASTRRLVLHARGNS